MAAGENDSNWNTGAPSIDPSKIYGPTLYFFVVSEKDTGGGDREGRDTPSGPKEYGYGFDDLGSSDLGGSYQA